MRHLTEHLKSVNETYFEHLYHALRFALKMITGGLAVLLHAIFPFLFIKTGSRLIERLHHDMVTHRFDSSSDSSSNS